MVPIGIIGLGAAWESRYRPAVESLRSRVVPRVIYDAVPSRATHAAGELSVDSIHGLMALRRRPDLKAYLVLETGWAGAETVRLLCAAGRPIFVGGNLPGDDIALERLGRAASDFGAMVMPELAQRYTPATFRLRELMATRLGRLKSVQIEAHLPDATSQPLGPHPREELFARLLDWCCALVPTQPEELSARVDATDETLSVRLQFTQPRSGGTPSLAEIQLRPLETASRERPESEQVIRVICERGVAELHAGDRIVWEVAGEKQAEHLAADRTDLQVMLDHFLRRVVGGLIPVANLDDLRRSRRLIAAIETSLQTNCAVGVRNAFLEN